MSDESLLKMAREWYGYGWWEAPFWFIGPEPGRPEKEDTLRERYRAWMNLRGGELIDCKSHHFGFGWHDWHREVPPPRTQPTWRSLIRLLLPLSGNCKSPNIEDIRTYQQRRWGMRTNSSGEETCVIELCSLASPKLKAKKNVPFDSNCFLNQRITTIRRRIEENKPKLVLMYGLSHAHRFQEIANCVLSPGEPQRIGSTCFVRTLAPTAHGLDTRYWTELAERLRSSMH